MYATACILHGTYWSSSAPVRSSGITEHVPSWLYFNAMDVVNYSTAPFQHNRSVMHVYISNVVKEKPIQLFKGKRGQYL